MKNNWFGNVLNLYNNDLIIAKKSFVYHMLHLLQLEANFFKRYNITSGKVILSLKLPYIKNIKMRFDQLALSTLNTPCNIVRVEVKELLEVLVLALHM